MSRDGRRQAKGAALLLARSRSRPSVDTEPAMSRENVELAHQVYDAFNRRDVDAFLALMDADVKGTSVLVAFEGGQNGHDGMRRWWKNLLDVFPDFTMDAVDVRDVGNVTVAKLRNRGHGMGSDTPVEITLWNVAEWRDKKVVWWRSYETDAEALEAVRLRE
jgi:ketosteroid isomerase-like protein